MTNQEKGLLLVIAYFVYQHFTAPPAAAAPPVVGNPPAGGSSSPDGTSDGSSSSGGGSISSQQQLQVGVICLDPNGAPYRIPMGPCPPGQTLPPFGANYIPPGLLDPVYTGPIAVV